MLRAPLPLLLLAAVLYLAASLPALGQENEDLEALSIGELMEVEVVTASRRSEPLAQVAGAITVLDEEDIFHSGATTIPEVLKLIPGVHVAQSDTDKWAVGLRGFNGLFNNKHLVLLDGRPITSPLSDGVFWGGNGIPLNTVKRIEVVRGPWTSLWGSDSFTGVINIITKPAAETQGEQSVTVIGSTGMEQTVRTGGTTEGGVGYRLYAKALYNSGGWISENPEPHSSTDWIQGRVGFRTDWTNAFTDQLSIQGEVAGSQINDGGAGSQHNGPPLSKDDYVSYGQLTWDRATGLDAGIKFRTSLTHETEYIGDMDSTTNIWDMELQYAVEQMGAHRFTMGVGNRYIWNVIDSGANVTIGRGDTYTTETNAFLQDRITLLPESLYLFLGSKLDYLEDCSLEVQPTIRLLHTRDKQEYWLAVSKAVRSGNLWQQEGGYFLNRGGVLYTVVANGNLSSEKMTSYEAGYRRIVSEDMRFDVSFYVNDYDKLTKLEFNEVAQTATLVNSLKGTAYGVEILADWKAAPWLNLRPSISLIRQQVYGSDPNPTGDSMPEDGTEGELKLQVATKLSKEVGFDVLAAYVDSPTQTHLPARFALDAHASWQVNDSLLLELIARNLSGTYEQFSSLKIGPGLDLRITWDF